MTILATVVILFSLNNIFSKRLVISEIFDKRWQLFFGIISGFVGGLTSILGVVGVLYLSLKNLKPNQFVAGNGLFIFIGCISVGSGYLISGVLQPYMLFPALFGTLSAFLGFYFGAYLRNFLSPENFYKIIWFLFLATGIRLAITAISKF